MLITEILAILSIAAATGLRVALPLLIIGLMSGEKLWGNVPLLSQLPPTLCIGVLVSWSAAELMLSKDSYKQRIFQIAELILSPGVAVLAAIAVARTLDLAPWITVITAVVGALLALVIQLLQVGWFYRPKRPPAWLFFVIDGLCVMLAFLTFDAPRKGGLIALLLLWLVIRTSYVWQNWSRRR
ncbi:DUF4126 domain-containing protein [Leptolyngbya sp. BL0902]|uniref:DUF4126 domain-containing protein n=1 Tax=Leptolyngbya sp. BL0902 TaxID=1115757 RepID=UPI0018E72535|nr:DUF4126 domain-containing protein [Leptolyngbya sp. BL0902]QQE64527.1 DUF4126 domain-containing protein [Leptolyngbya sp. BL0902]